MVHGMVAFFLYLSMFDPDYIENRQPIGTKITCENLDGQMVTVYTAVYETEEQYFERLSNKECQIIANILIKAALQGELEIAIQEGRYEDAALKRDVLKDL